MADELRQQAFDREFRGQIERFTQRLITALRRIVTTPVPPVVKVLAFEMQADWGNFPVYAFGMDVKSLDEAYFEPPFNGHVLPDAGELVPDGAIDQDGYEMAGIATYESGARVMAVWFGECWHAAGGALFSIPTYIHLHDDLDYFDLRTRLWVRNTNPSA